MPLALPPPPPPPPSNGGQAADNNSLGPAPQGPTPMLWGPHMVPMPPTSWSPIRSEPATPMAKAPPPNRSMDLDNKNGKRQRDSGDESMAGSPMQPPPPPPPPPPAASAVVQPDNPVTPVQQQTSRSPRSRSDYRDRDDGAEVQKGIRSVICKVLSPFARSRSRPWTLRHDQAGW